jgi:hypothetical protein
VSVACKSVAPVLGVFGLLAISEQGCNAIMGFRSGVLSDGGLGEPCNATINCGHPDCPPTTPPSAPCSGTLVCVGNLCASPCTADSDCPGGERCLFSDGPPHGLYGCVPVNSPCFSPCSDPGTPRTCAPDGQCRNICNGNAACATDQTCESACQTTPTSCPGVCYGPHDPGVDASTSSRGASTGTASGASSGGASGVAAGMTSGSTSGVASGASAGTTSGSTSGATSGASAGTAGASGASMAARDAGASGASTGSASGASAGASSGTSSGAVSGSSGATATCPGPPTALSGGVPFVVDSAFFAAGFYGDYAGLAMPSDTAGAACGGRAMPSARGKCYRASYAVTAPAGGTTGIAWQANLQPMGGGTYYVNFGTAPGVIPPSGASKATFWAKGAVGGEIVQFFVGAAEVACQDSVNQYVTFTLTANWTLYTIPFNGQTYQKGQVAGFGWQIGANCCGSKEVSAGAKTTFYIDDIVWN